MSTVSILLPFHNAEATLGLAINSLTRQTFRDLRILLIDNGSTDRSRVVAIEQARNDARIQIIEEPLLGIANALNAGLDHAEGTFIARMDADDLAHPERLARQVAYLDACPEIGVLGTRTCFKTTVENSSGMRSFVSWQNAILSPHDHFVKRFVDAPIAHPSVMFRKELVTRHGRYDTGPLPEDHELWLRWMDAGVRFAKLPEELLTWNDSSTRLSRTHANYSTAAFFRTKVQWLAKWMDRTLNGRPVIIAGSSSLCRERAAMLAAQGITINAFTDVSGRPVTGHLFIPPDELPPRGEAFIVSFISQRGTGDRIASFLSGRGLVEGEDFILAA